MTPQKQHSSDWPRATIRLMHWQKTLGWFLLATACALTLQLVWQITYGWIVLGLGFGALTTWRRYQAARVAAWLKAPQDIAPPDDVGPWSEVVRQLEHHMQAQQQLLNEAQETNEAVMAAAQALPVGVIALDQSLSIIWFNKAARQQLNLEEQTDLGSNLLHLIRQPDFVRYARQRNWPQPLVVKLQQGSQDKLLMMQFVIYSRLQRLLITRDLTQLDKLETTRRDFVANVSHELRTPLTVLSGFIETLTEAPAGALSDDQTHQYMSLMREQAKRMQSIVSDLLTLSTLETTPVAEQVFINMTDLTQGMRQQIEALSGARHQFEWDIEDGLDLLGAPTELTSAFSNLLTNAVRYTPDGGRIRIRWARERGGRARFSVKDTGIGIAAEHIPRLSERFYRVDRSRSRAAGGTGLGLAITKHVAMRHNAQLDIESRLREGSTFSLVFPAERLASEDVKDN
jgi:two-component system, OmpR family, phosphate regulon sensor histidine kinase PhoR